MPKKVAKIDMLVGRNVSKLRKGVGISQEKLAAEIGMSRASIVNIENGRQAVTMSTLYRICISLDTTPAEVLPTLDELLGNMDSMVATLVEGGIDEPSARAFIAQQLLGEI